MGYPGCGIPLIAKCAMNGARKSFGWGWEGNYGDSGFARMTFVLGMASWVVEAGCCRGGFRRCLGRGRFVTDLAWYVCVGWFHHDLVVHGL